MIVQWELVSNNQGYFMVSSQNWPATETASRVWAHTPLVMVQLAYKVVKLAGVAVHINSVKTSDLIKWNCTPRHLEICWPYWCFLEPSPLHAV